MNDLLERLSHAIDIRLRGPAFSRFLERLGIDPRRYWLLMDLFAKLSGRQEMLGQLGRQDYALKLSGGMFLILSAVGSAGFVLLGGRPIVLFGVALGLTAFMLLGILISETANSLVNPVEGLVLAHQPINGATYTGAKLSHLLRVVLVFVGTLNVIPAFAGILLKDAPWLYPILHLSAAFLTGLLVAMFCCSVFGWLFRFVSPRKLKHAAQFAQGIPIAIVLLPKRALGNVIQQSFTWLMEGPLHFVPWWSVVLAGVVAIALSVVFGLRSLSSDYLIRVSSMVHGSANARTRIRRSFTGDLVRTLFGGQVSVAAFDYMRRMMLRDWQFRRQLLTISPLLFFAVVGAAGAGNISPFSGRFSTAHLIPHFLGLMFFSVCTFLPYGNDYKGIWIFHLVPDRAFLRFARGVHASLWLSLAIAPHLVLLLIFIWRWGIADAVIFIAFSVAATTIHLAFAMRLIQGIPFGKQADPTRAAAMQGGMLFFMIGFVVVVGACVGIQFLVFHSYLAAVVLTLLVGGAAFITTRHSLGKFEASIRYNLALESTASKLIYTEVDTL